METIKRQCQVVMLPLYVSKRYNCTEGLIVKCVKSWTPIGEAPKEINKLSVYKNWSTGVLDHYEPQHLYFTSDEDIKEGEPHIFTFETFDEIIETRVETKLIVGYSYNKDVEVRKKIIASTDTSLGLPQPSPAFVEKYISEYNKGNLIEKVVVEYDGDYDEYYGGYYAETVKPKVSKDNTITISKVKDSWNRAEVIAFTTELRQFINSGNKSIYDVDKWINKNL